MNVIEKTEVYIPDIIDVLLQHGSSYMRLKAAMELKRYHTSEVIPVLFKAFRDPDYLVRNHASESLLGLRGFERNISSHKEIFGHICYSLDREGATQNKCKSAWDTAAKMLQDLFISRKPQKTEKE